MGGDFSTRAMKQLYLWKIWDFGFSRWKSALFPLELYNVPPPHTHTYIHNGATEIPPKEKGPEFNTIYITASSEIPVYIYESMLVSNANDCYRKNALSWRMKVFVNVPFHFKRGWWKAQAAALHCSFIFIQTAWFTWCSFCDTGVGNHKCRCRKRESHHSSWVQ